MAITEQSRHELYQHIVETMGAERAATLMEHLPPVGWADVATKQDLETLRAATKQDLEMLRLATDAQIANVRAEFHKGLRVHTLGIIVANATFTSIAVALAA